MENTKDILIRNLLYRDDKNLSEERRKELVESFKDIISERIFLAIAKVKDINQTSRELSELRLKHYPYYAEHGNEKFARQASQIISNGIVEKCLEDNEEKTKEDSTRFRLRNSNNKLKKIKEAKNV